ncbi:MAG: hypothetical protein ACM3JL_01280 [Nitrososphaerota archaeon]
MNRIHASRSLLGNLSVATGIALVVALLLASAASAGLEQVATFAEGSGGKQFEPQEQEQLAHADGMTVNTAGAGGVAAGTVYVATGRSSVAVFGPEGEFREAWGWGVADRANEFERCGPYGEPAHPNCLAGNEVGTGSEGGEGIGQITGGRAVAVDQVNGYVYVLNDATASRKDNLIEVFKADGTEVVARFGEAGAFKETFDEGPAKIHSERPSGLAVDESGTVYISDQKSPASEETRIMVFEPETPGDYEHYVYAGRARDIAAKYPNALAVDSSGNVYAQWEERIYEFTPGKPSAPACEFIEPKRGMNALTVNPDTGEPFYFSYKDERIHQLGPCNSEGRFEPRADFELQPTTTSVAALTFNPGLRYEPSREPGALYAAAAFTEAQHEHELPIGEEEYIWGRGYIFAPAEAHPPTVESESVFGVTATTANLSAQVNPQGFPTRYVFQYLPAEQYEANPPGEEFAGSQEVPAGGALLGSGKKELTGSAAAVGLSADTDYRYRVIARSNCEPANEEEVCEVPGPAAAFRTFPLEAPGLHDKRAWELVSPVEKQSGEVFPIHPYKSSCFVECKPGIGAVRFPVQSAPGGDAVVYEGQPFSSAGARVYNEYLARRGPGGWETTTLAPALMGASQGGRDQGYKAFDPSLREGVFYQFTPTLSGDAPSEYVNLYRQPTENPFALSSLLTAPPPHRATGGTGASSLQLAFGGASNDFSRLFFAANDALTGATASAPAALDGGAAKFNLYEWAGGELRLVNVAPGNAATAPGARFGGAPEGFAPSETLPDLSHAVSEDGSRVFWSDESGQVYVRENGEATIAVPDPAPFLAAAADGSRVLLRDGALYDLESGELLDLTGGEGGFRGIAGQSEDLSAVYFVDTAVLTGGEENQYGAAALAGKNNLYLWREGALAFVATLGASDNATEFAAGDWRFSPTNRSAQASPDGGHLAFLSWTPLSGYDNTGPCERKEGKNLPGVCVEVFLYDAATGRLSCPSCNRSGAHPLGRSTLPFVEQSPGDTVAQPRYLLDSGRLYFDSEDSLTPFDSNRGVEDVYEYEPSGVGECAREEGCVSLISSGHGYVDSNFLAVDSTGKNVFFTSRDQLVPADHDELIDLYDAREGGGIPGQSEAPPGECQGEACQPQVSAPNDPTPGSASFEGAGNLPPHHHGCRRGKVRRHGKCVRKHHHHRRHHHHHRRRNRHRGGSK